MREIRPIISKRVMDDGHIFVGVLSAVIMLLANATLPLDYMAFVGGVVIINLIVSVTILYLIAEDEYREMNSEIDVFIILPRRVKCNGIDKITSLKWVTQYKTFRKNKAGRWGTDVSYHCIKD